MILFWMNISLYHKSDFHLWSEWRENCENIIKSKKIQKDFKDEELLKYLELKTAAYL